MIKNKTKPVFAGFFCGIGGFDKGSKLAGAETIYQTDNWLPVEKVFNANYHTRSQFPLDDYRTNEGVFHNASIVDLYLNTHPRPSNVVGIRDKLLQYDADRFEHFDKGDIDCILTGSPCQGMSHANNANVEPFNFTNKLMNVQVRVACQELEAKVVIMEQVPGIHYKKMEDFYELFEQVCRTTGRAYNMKSKILNAKYYGGYQDRERVIIMAVHKDLGVMPKFPEPSPVVYDAYMQNLLPNVREIFIKTTKKDRENTRNAEGISN